MVERIAPRFDSFRDGEGSDAPFSPLRDGRSEARTPGVAPSSALHPEPRSNGSVPVAGDDVFSGPESQPLVLTPLANDQGAGLAITHVAGQAISVGGTVTLAGIGTVRLNADQTLTFTPINELDGRQTFDYTIRNAGGLSDIGTIHVDLAGQSAGVGLTIAPPPVTVGAEFAVSAGSAISVAALAGGGHVVSWSQNMSVGSPSGTYSVFARVYDANGVATGGQITLASSIPTPVREDGQISALPNGGFLAVYMTAQGLQARQFNAAGAAVTGAVSLAGSTTLSGVIDVTTTVSGETIILYGTPGVVSLQRVSASGVLVGGPVQLTGSSHEVVSTPGGGYALVWDGGSATMLQLVSADGTAGEARAVVTTSAAGQPAFVWMPDGTGLVIHHNERSSLSTLIGQRVSPDGTPIGPQMQLGSIGNALFANPSVVPLVDGGFFLVWENATLGQPRSVVGQRFDALGNAVGDRIVLRSDTTNALGSGQNVVIDASGTVIVTYAEDGQVLRRMLDFPSAASGDEDTVIPLVIQMTQVNPDERGQVIITGLPAVAVLSAGVRREDGSWLLERDQLTGLTLTAPDFAGTIQIQVTAFTDGDIANGVTRTFGATFRPVADAPRLQNDTLATAEDVVVILNPLANDREVDGESMTITHINGTAIVIGGSVTLAGVGALKLNADGTLTFTPVTHWSGQSGFTYTVRDSSGASSTATATLQVAGVTDGATFSYGQLANWTPVAIDAADVRVNATTVGVQSQSSVAALADGGYVITWVSAGQDGSGLGVYAQRYDRLGQKIGGEFQVNHLTAGDQQHTAILAMEDGGWVIAWSGPVEGTGKTGIYARRYDADGAVVQTHLVTDASFNSQFYSGTAYNQGSPTLTAWGDDGFAIGWTTFYSATDNDTWIRQYGADGTMLGDHWIESDAELEDHPQMVTGADGVVLVIYQDSSGFYNGPTSGMDKDYGIWIERHGLNGGLSNPVQLNTTIVGNQTHPTLKILANGNIVAAWQSADASGTGITFRLLNPEGEPILAERRANQTTAGNQTSPGIVALADGTFLILWTSAGQDGSGAGVYGQRISADGTLYLGSEFRLNATTAGDQLSDSAITDTSFTVLEDGTLVATWWGDGEVHHRRFDPPEAAFTAYQGQQIAIPLTVTLVDASETFELAISNLPPGAVLSAGTQRADGAWVVTAAQAANLTLTPPPGYAGDMLLRIEITTVDGDSRATAITYRPVQVLPIDNDADGAVVSFRTGADPFTAGDVTVTNVINANYDDPAVAALANGRYVVTWSDSFGDVHAQLLEYDGRYVPVPGAWSSWFQVNTYETNTQNGPTPLALADGAFVVFWHSYGQDGSEWGIYGQRFTASGTPAGSEFRVNTTTALTQEAPTAVALSDGGFVVIFESQPATGRFEIRGQRYDASGAPEGAEFQVRGVGASGNQRWPDVSALEDGGFVAVWSNSESDGSGGGISMRVYDARNDASTYWVNQYANGTQQEAKVTTLADGSIVVTWTTFADQPGADHGVYARRFEITDEGLVGGTEWEVTAGLTGAHRDSDVVALPDGGYVIVWHWITADDAATDIYARRYDSDGRPVGGAFRIHSETYGDQQSRDLYSDPMVTVDHNGDLLVVWSDSRDGNIYSRRFDIDPEPPFFGEAGEPIRLAIEVQSRDSAETVEIVLSNVPNGAVLSAGTRQADGSWLVGLDDLEGLTLTTPSAYSGTGFDLIVTVTTRQGADSLTTVAYHRVQVLPAPPGITLAGSDGADALVGGGGGDTITGLSGDDAITGARGDDAIDGGDGTDTAIFSGARAGYTVSTIGGVTTVSGPDGTDSLVNVERLQFSDMTLIVGAGGGQYFAGTGGADTISGTAFSDEIVGGGGDDRLAGGAGNDRIGGGDGIDTAVFSGPRAGYVISTVGGTTTVSGPDGTDRLTGIERLRFADGLFDLGGAQIEDVTNGTPGPDALNGDAIGNTLNGLGGGDVLSGGAGNDILNGGAGDDVLDGGAGDDALNGGDGVDTADYSDATAGVTVSLAITGRGQNTVGAGRDILSGIENLTGSAFRDYFTGDAGNNVLTDSLGGNDRLLGGAGDDTLSVRRSGAGAATEVTLTGGIGDDTMTFDGNGRFTDTVVFEGQDGEDVISALGAFKANVNGGAGNDRVTVDTLGGSFVVKLGSGVDTLVLASTDGGFGGGAANLVRDFVAGAGGDIVDLTQYLGGGALTNYTPGSNPFLDGHMRLVQAGEDTLLQVDRDGGSNSFVTVMTLQKTFASSFTAFNFNGLAPLPDPVEGGAGVDSLTGTSGMDVLNGNGGNDTLVGLAGADVLNGGAGNDVLDGGDGDDVLNGGSGAQGDTATYATASAGVTVNLGVSGLQNTGGSGFDSLTGIEHLTGSAFTDELRGDANANRLTDTLGGNDFLRGEAGDDTILITRSGAGAATTVRLNGGDGNDALTFTGNGRFTDIVTLEGEAGNDVITASGAGTIGIDAGAGDDTVIYDTLGGAFRITLGTGTDTVRLAGTGGAFAASADNLLRDFVAGAGGDVVDLSAYLSGGALLNYTGGDNPFADGHMRLVQAGSRTLLQVDRDGGGNGYQTILAFANTTVGSFTAANFNGIDPTGAAPMPLPSEDKDPGPQVLPGLVDGGDDGLGKAAGPEVLPGLTPAGDNFLVLPKAGDAPEVLPAEQFDAPARPDADRFPALLGPAALAVDETGHIRNTADPHDPGNDGWLF